MVTLTQIIQYYVRKQSEEIHRLKSEGLVTETLEKIAYVSPDGKSFINRGSRKHDRVKDWKLARVSYERLTGYMSPRHPQWHLYVSAKKRASLLLTARHILKLNCESIPDFRKLMIDLRTGRLSHHAHRGKTRQLVIQAYGLLRKIGNRLDHNPDKLQSVETEIARIQASFSEQKEAVND